MHSMTGFGRGIAGAAGTTVEVEVRSVNGRYVEVGVRLPRELAAREVEIQDRTKARLQRGKVSVSIRVEHGEATTPEISVSEDLAGAYARALERLRQSAGIPGPVKLEHLLQIGGLLQTTEEPTHDDADEYAELIFEALDEALEACERMRAAEGEALAADLRERLHAMERELEAVEQAAPQRLVDARDVLRKRIEDLLDGNMRLDESRLETEIAFLADRLDISEECTRLRSHIAQFRDALDAEDPVGRRLNFLSQELNREINTIASKANDAEIGARVVSMKEELERIREQVQNVA